jgi:hypothetical protein
MINWMMDPNPLNRPTIDEILAHPRICHMQAINDIIEQAPIALREL